MAAPPTIFAAPPLHLPAAMRDEIIAHARADAPRECCGIISGRDGKLVRLYRLPNTEPGVDRYLIDPNALYKAWRAIEEAGLEIAAIYHSHPMSIAYPSRTDVAEAHWPEAYYLICSLSNPDNPVVRAFQILDETIAEAEVVVE